jgi:cation transport ATPase
MRSLLITSLVLFIAISSGTQALAQQKAKKGETISIKTSAQCEMCKERLEMAMAYEKGVYESELNLETKEFSVRFNPKKTDATKIKDAISKTGYDADDEAADEKAYEKLPACCKKPDDPDYIGH